MQYLFFIFRLLISQTALMMDVERGDNIRLTLVPKRGDIRKGSKVDKSFLRFKNFTQLFEKLGSQ